MEIPRPMDRLICGDVGFGKTEVAIRAAFKAVIDGRQVAVLAPTTLLAQQHFEVFRRGMLDYPVRIEMLSRFRSQSEQRKILELLRQGGVDIVIGTHRLISGDVIFKDLGLAVIDEEQRFGVLHKEKFKELFKLVDVLTLSATPIPRTLYLSLVGVKDMSTIETPPLNRLPVETIVCGYDERIIRDAINRELERQGQVYFLHNRVQTIERVREKIIDFVPNARVEVGHGQMDADELEEVMARFVAGKIDVLVCTTIIESGLDIPDPNNAFRRSFRPITLATPGCESKPIARSPESAPASNSTASSANGGIGLGSSWKRLTTSSSSPKSSSPPPKPVSVAWKCASES